MIMDPTKILKLAFFLVFLVLNLKTKCQSYLFPPYASPLCASQFALVNHACAMLPYMPLPPPSPPSPPPSPPPLPPSPPSPPSPPLPPCPPLPPSPPSPPSPPLPPSPCPPDDDDRDHGNKHRHRHAHGHGHRYQESPVEQECCQLLKEVDTECVCGILVHLPPFLSKPLHNYTVTVDKSCSVTFQCAGRLSV